MLSRRKDCIYSSREENCSDFPPNCGRRAQQRCPPGQLLVLYSLLSTSQCRLCLWTDWCPGYSWRTKDGGFGASPVWSVLLPTSSTRQKRHMVVQTTPTACHSQYYFYLKQINTYQGSPPIWKKCAASIHGAYGNFPKKLLACSSACPKEYQTHRSGIDGTCPPCKLPIIFYAFCLEVIVQKNEDKKKMWPGLATLNLKGIPDQICTRSWHR